VIPVSRPACPAARYPLTEALHLPPDFVDLPRVIGLAERCRRHQAAPLLERTTPEFAHEDRVVAHIGDAPWCAPVLEQHKAPADQDDLTLAIGAPSSARR